MTKIPDNFWGSHAHTNMFTHTNTYTQIRGRPKSHYTNTKYRKRKVQKCSLPNAVNIRRIWITVEPRFQAAVWRLAIHIPSSNKKSNNIIAKKKKKNN